MKPLSGRISMRSAARTARSAHTVAWSAPTSARTAASRSRRRLASVRAVAHSPSQVVARHPSALRLQKGHVGAPAVAATDWRPSSLRQTKPTSAASRRMQRRSRPRKRSCPSSSAAAQTPGSRAGPLVWESGSLKIPPTGQPRTSFPCRTNITSGEGSVPKQMFTMQYPVEHNIPLPPPRRSGPSRKERRPWSEMVVGDSFFVPDGEIHAERCAAASASRAKAKQFVARVVDGGIRVWRLR